jgi:hypothetical protein
VTQEAIRLDLFKARVRQAVFPLEREACRQNHGATQLCWRRVLLFQRLELLVATGSMRRTEATRSVVIIYTNKKMVVERHGAQQNIFRAFGNSFELV